MSNLHHHMAQYRVNDDEQTPHGGGGEGERKGERVEDDEELYSLVYWAEIVDKRQTP